MTVHFSRLVISQTLSPFHIALALRGKVILRTVYLRTDTEEIENVVSRNFDYFTF